MQCCARHARGAWLVGHNTVQAVWKQDGEEADFKPMPESGLDWLICSQLARQKFSWDSVVPDDAAVQQELEEGGSDAVVSPSLYGEVGAEGGASVIRSTKASTWFSRN